MKYLIIIFLLVYAVVFASCSNSSEEEGISTQPPSPLENMQWMLGTWQMKGDSMAFFEQWTELNDSSFEGKGFFVKLQDDTVLTENLRLESENGEIFYRAKPVRSKTGEWVSFKYTNSEDGKLHFSNPRHDFPQEIVYEQVGTDSTHVAVQGNVQGQLVQDLFKMGKAK